MSERDIFAEVEEDLRREQLARLWDKYGVYVLAAAAAIILFVGAYNGYRWYQGKQAAENGAAFVRASGLLDQQKYAEAREAFSGMTKDAPAGYRVLSKMELAAIAARENRKAEAVALYDEVASEGGTDAMLKDFAKVQAAALRLDEAEPAEISRRLDKLDADSSPWRHSARELLALSAYRSANTAESVKLFNRILSDPFAPAEMRKRAEAMLALIVRAPASPAAQAGPQKDNATQ